MGFIGQICNKEIELIQYIDTLHNSLPWGLFGSNYCQNSVCCCPQYILSKTVFKKETHVKKNVDLFYTHNENK